MSNWQIENALAMLEGTKTQTEQQLEELGTAPPVSTEIRILREKAQTRIAAMNYAIEVVKDIERLTPPDPPDLGKEFRKLVTSLRHELAAVLCKTADWLEL